MWAYGLVYPLFVARTTWFGLPVCSAKGEWEGHGVECHKIRDGINLQVVLTLGERTMRLVKLLLSRGGSLMIGEVDWVRAGLGGVWRMDGPKLRPKTSTSIGIGESGWDEMRCIYWGWLVCSFWHNPTLGTFQVFVVCVSRKASLTEGSDCGCLSNHDTIVESLGPSLWIV